MNKFVIGGIGLAGLAIVGGIAIGTVKFVKDCKEAHNAGLTLKEFKAAKEDQTKAAAQAQNVATA
jgi:branched-subunit amino acid ABC-type transport system permease component